MSNMQRLPLFYHEPQALSSLIHAAWRLTEGDVAFAAATPFVPIVTGEFEKASHDYPVVFAADNLMPMALLGLANANLFIRESAWMADHYVPAYVRRYPFAFISTDAPDRFILGIDAASSRIRRTGEEGMALFAAGTPSDLTRNALGFCNAYHAEAKATDNFCAALNDQGLLIDQRADARFPDGRSFGLDGFRIVDEKRLGELDGSVVADWHRNGWLKLIHFHLASLRCFSTLLKLEGERGRPSSLPSPCAAISPVGDHEDG